MAPDIRIISRGATNYLVNSTGAPVAGGAATGPTTTPFAIFNDQWTIQVAQPVTAYQGGPPLVNGAEPVYQAYANTQQSIPMSVEGSSHNNTASILRDLRNLLNTTLFGNPALLYYQPNGANNPLYFKIQSGAIQEKPEPLNPTGGFAYVEFDLILTLSPFGGQLSAGETLINAATFTNTGTGANNNTQVLSTGAGDLTTEGQPLNISIAPPATTYYQLYLASVFLRTYSTTGAAAYNTSSTTPVLAASLIAALSVSSVLTNNVKLRMLVKVTGIGSNVRLLAKLKLGDDYIYTGPAVAKSQYDPGGAGGGALLIDLGQLPVDIIKRIKGMTAPTVTCDLWHYSSDGAAATYTVVYSEYLFYYDFCTLTAFGAVVAASETILLNTFEEQTNAPCLPMTPIACVLSTGGVLQTQFTIRGTPPHYFNGASLYLAWFNATGADFGSAQTATVTVTHAPLWFAMRGAQ